MELGAVDIRMALVDQFFLRDDLLDLIVCQWL